jgi:hypothetical protein
MADSEASTQLFGQPGLFLIESHDRDLDGVDGGGVAHHDDGAGLSWV